LGKKFIIIFVIIAISITVISSAILLNEDNIIHLQDSEYPKLFIPTEVELSEDLVSDPYFNYDFTMDSSLQVSPLMKLNFEAFESDTINMNVFEKDILVEKEYTYRDRGTTFYWIGNIVDTEYNYVSLLVDKKKIIRGDISTPTNHYTIKKIDDEHFVIIDVDKNYKDIPELFSVVKPLTSFEQMYQEKHNEEFDPSPSNTKLTSPILQPMSGIFDSDTIIVNIFEKRFLVQREPDNYEWRYEYGMDEKGHAPKNLFSWNGNIQDPVSGTVDLTLYENGTLFYGEIRINGGIFNIGNIDGNYYVLAKDMDVPEIPDH
jgi:hypothetical protein